MKQTFIRPELNLSEENPIAVFPIIHTENGDEPQFDMHYELEMGIVLEGEMERWSGNDKKIFTENTAWFCNMWEPHGYSTIKKRCRILVIVIWPPMLMSMNFREAPKVNFMSPFLINSKEKPVCKIKDTDNLSSLVERFSSCSNEAEFGLSKIELRIALLDLLLLIFKNNPALLKHSSTGIKSESSISPALELVFTRKDLVKNTEAAKSCRMSRDIFVRKFQKMMGISFTRFALRHRLSNAAKMLVETDIPIKAIAYEWGFTDESHLYRCFSESYNCTPAAYRAARKSF
ncbi:MAG: helix-turn-helix domain-containing protein [Planctomycetota bacterium]|jgi:AraC-like DNA-binding protein